MLDIVEFIEVVVELHEGLRESEVGHGDGRHGDVGDFGAVGLEPLLFESVGDLIEAVDTAADTAPTPQRIPRSAQPSSSP